eukprot:83194_1
MSSSSKSNGFDHPTPRKKRLRQKKLFELKHFEKAPVKRARRQRVSATPAHSKSQRCSPSVLATPTYSLYAGTPPIQTRNLKMSAPPSVTPLKSPMVTSQQTVESPFVLHRQPSGAMANLSRQLNFSVADSNSTDRFMCKPLKLERLVRTTSSDSVSGLKNAKSLGPTDFGGLLGRTENGGFELDYLTPKDHNITPLSINDASEQLIIDRIPAKCPKSFGDSPSECTSDSDKREVREPITNVFLGHSSFPDDERKSKRRSLTSDGISIHTSSQFNLQFEYCQQVAKGSYGIVMKCRDRMDGCLYAVKRIKRPVTGNPNKNYKSNEVCALAAAQRRGGHPHVVRLVWKWFEARALYVVTEWCAGGGLHPEYITGRGGRSAAEIEADILVLALQIAKALSFMHGLGISHGDVKPPNILEARPGFFKLCDFGLSSAIEPGRRQILKEDGDPKYLALETLDSDGPVSLEKIDMFALGASLYELAIGKDLPTESEGFQSIRRGNLPGISKFSETFQKLVTSLMCPNPEKRPTSTETVMFLEKARASPTSIRARIRELESELARLREKEEKGEEEVDGTPQRGPSKRHATRSSGPLKGHAKIERKRC